MRSSIIKTLPLFGALLVAGCGTFTNPFNGQSVTITAADVQSAAVQACGFLPTASTIAAIISASPLVGTAGQIASLICQAVVPAKSGALRGVPTVNGVPVHGRWIN